MTQQHYNKTFDLIRMENLHHLLKEEHYTLTDVVCMYREQEGLNQFHYFPLHVYDVEFESMTQDDI